MNIAIDLHHILHHTINAAVLLGYYVVRDAFVMKVRNVEDDISIFLIALND